MLTVSRKKSFCKVLGPGIRSVIWFHGCGKNCPGCIVRTAGENSDYERLSPVQLADWVKENQPVEGITLSGGEPFDQPPNDLMNFLKIIRSDTDLSVLCYTGYQLDELQTNDNLRDLLNCIDVLIDGQYEIENDNNQLWRGSENQKFHFLTDRYKQHAIEWFAARGREIEIEVDISGHFSLSGLPQKYFMENLTGKLREKGVSLHFDEEE
ncbi:MAG: 4Fe-4S single cluster domain-containing protein [Fibrobacter sp.]|nr:4Fe-4S single cluster domain-containing protein [Fibrobacter sp.]